MGRFGVAGEGGVYEPQQFLRVWKMQLMRHSVVKKLCSVSCTHTRMEAQKLFQHKAGKMSGCGSRELQARELHLIPHCVLST